MKKLVFGLMMALAVVTLVSAQAGRSPAATNGTAVTAQETVKVDGKLALIDGRIAVKSGDKTYYLNNIGRLTGFIDGLKEGAAIKAEGYVCAIDTETANTNVMVTKLTVNGKDYDLGATGGMGNRGGMGRMGGDNSASCANCNTENNSGRMGGRGGMMGGRR